MIISSDPESLHVRSLNMCLPGEAAEQVGETPVSGAWREHSLTLPSLLLVSLGAPLTSGYPLISSCFLPLSLCTALTSLCFLLAWLVPAQSLEINLNITSSGNLLLPPLQGKGQDLLLNALRAYSHT